VDGDGHVLREGFVEHPELAVRGRLHTPCPL
jgi:hypothetical protein